MSLEPQFTPPDLPEGALPGKSTIKPPAFIWILIVIIGLLGSFRIYKMYIPTKIQKNDSSNQDIFNQIFSTFKFINTKQEDGRTGILPYNSGIKGTATIGLTCPVERDPPDPNCADRIYQATLSIKNQAGKVVINFKINADGSFFNLIAV